MRLKVSSGKWRPSCLGLSVLTFQLLSHFIISQLWCQTAISHHLIQSECRSTTSYRVTRTHNRLKDQKTKPISEIAIIGLPFEQEFWYLHHYWIRQVEGQLDGLRMLGFVNEIFTNTCIMGSVFKKACKCGKLWLQTHRLISHLLNKINIRKQTLQGTHFILIRCFPNPVYRYNKQERAPKRVGLRRRPKWLECALYQKQSQSLLWAEMKKSVDRAWHKSYFFLLRNDKKLNWETEFPGMKKEGASI